MTWRRAGTNDEGALGTPMKPRGRRFSPLSEIGADVFRERSINDVRGPLSPVVGAQKNWECAPVHCAHLRAF
eukprot:5858049-Pyramimonas_sp.AAC.1